MTTTNSLDPMNMASLFSFLSQNSYLWSSFFSNPQQLSLLQQSYGAGGSESVSTAGTAVIQNQVENQAYIIEVIKTQIGAAIRNAQIQGKQVADFAQFLDPSRVPMGPGVQLQTPVAGDTSAFYGQDRAFLAQNFQLGTYDLGISNNLGFHAPNIMGPWPTTNQQLVLGNRVTGNGLTIDGDNIKFNVGGQVTSGSLKNILKITATNKTGTINLENGTKLTFSYKDGANNTQVLDQIFVTNPDGSFATLKAGTDAQGHQTFTSENGQKSADLLNFQDQLVPDGTSLFMSPEGASLYGVSPLTGDFAGVFGDPRSLALGLRAASFGGNLYNFYFSATDQGWHAQQMIPKFVNFMGWPSGGGDWGGAFNLPNGFPQSFDPSGGYCQDGFMPVNCPPGFNPPPQTYNPLCNWGPNVPAVIGGDKIEDLIMEDMTGKDKSGTLQAAKNAFLKYQLKYGHMDFETKLMVLLYLFLDQNGQETDEIFKKLSGVGSDDLTNGTQAPKQTWSRQNINNGSIKDQIDFWSNYKPANLSRDQNTRNEQLSQNATMVNGKLKSLEVDQSLLQARLTNLIRDRERMIETVTNAMKALDDALSNTVRRIV